MEILLIDENSPIEELRRLSVHLGGDFEEGVEAARLTLNNENGKGYINTYEVYPGLTVKTYNITLTKELRFSKNEPSNSPLYFVYSLKGYYYHKFDGEKEIQRIAQMQNVMVSSALNSKHYIVLPADVKLQISVLFLVRDKFLAAETRKKSLLATALEQVFALEARDHKPHKYFGHIDLRTAKYAGLLIKNKRTDVVGKLVTAGAVLNTLASQVESINTSEKLAHASASYLSNKEMDKMMSVINYIANNLNSVLTVSYLSGKFGLSPKKMQAAIKYLYGTTLGNFIRDLRLEYAKELIQTTDMTISEVCYTIGFNNRSYFSSIFGYKYGVLPSKFRQSLLSKKALFELSYQSTADAGLTKADLKDILDCSRKNNKENDITGCLVHHKNQFFQIIEGSKGDILKLYDIIKDDVRHGNVRLLWKGIKANRTFGDWSMAMVSENGNFKFANGRPIDFKLDALINSDKEPVVSSDLLWKRVRNLLRVTG